MATNKKKQKLSIYLLKKDIKQFVSALKNRRDVDEYKLKGTLKLDGIIYIGKTKEKDFAWQYFLQDGTDKQIPELKNASNRAVLMMRIEGRIYVLPFGFGKHLIREDTIEREFGLKAALNMVDPDKLRSIDKANLDDLTVLTKTQTSRRAKPQEFNIDVVRDLMRGVTGEPSSEYEKLGTVVTGSEGVYTIPLIEFEDIPDHLRMLKKGYQSRAYKARFDWVDNLKYERDPTTIESLQDKLIEALKSKDLNNIHLSPPVMIEWESYEGISYTAKGDLQSELDISSFYNIRNDDLRELDWDKLKRQRIFIKYADKDDAIPVSLITQI